MTKNLFLSAAISLTAAVTLTACSGGDAPAAKQSADSKAPAATGSRDQIKIVGSSTVYPFSTAVAETFGKTSNFKTPIVESTGSGGGLKLFCGGVGERHPDITNASRRIKSSEVELCAKNGVADIVETKVGYDGIVLANSRKSDRLEVSLQQVFLALAKDIPDGNGGLKANPYTRWNEIDASLPNKRIEIMGPPPTSGTRDAFVELAMEGGCKTFPSIAAMKSSDKNRYKAVCHSMREDEAFVESGENDNLIVQKLNANPDAYGIFGYSFLDQNAGQVQGALINGVAPEFENIADNSYPVARSLYFYTKKAHVGVVPGIEAFLAEFLGNKASGPDGYLADKGLIPMPAAEHAKVKASTLALTPLSLK